MNSKESMIRFGNKDQNSISFFMNPDATRFVPRVANEKYHFQVFPLHRCYLQFCNLYVLQK